MSACRYCTQLIGFNRVAGKWRPTNPDGSPHICTGPKNRVHDVNHEPGIPITGAHYMPSYTRWRW